MHVPPQSFLEKVTSRRQSHSGGLPRIAGT